MAVFLNYSLTKRYEQSNRLLNALFEKQREAFIYNTSKRTCCLCTRRAGKTFGAIAILMALANVMEDNTYLYCALTTKQTKIVAWKIIKEISRKYDIQVQMNKQDMEIVFQSGSSLFLFGCEKDVVSERIVGSKCSLIIIDEADRFKPDALFNLVEEVLEPTLWDTMGRLIMISTPFKNPSGFFFDISSGKNSEYRVFKWSVFDNPHMAKQARKQLDNKIKANPEYINTAVYKRNWLGEYVYEEGDLCYKYDDKKHSIESKDYTPDADEKYYLGVDLGYQDNTAFIVIGSSCNRKELIVVHSEKHKRLDIDLISEKIRSFQKTYPGIQIYADASNKLAYESICNSKDGKIRMKPAYKTRDKMEMIEWVNDELILRRLLFLDSDHSPLVKEMKELMRVEYKDVVRENQKQENDCCDAMIYAVKAASDAHKLKEKKRQLTTKELVDLDMDRIIEKQNSGNRFRKKWY